MILSEVIERVRLLASNLGGGPPDARLLGSEVIVEIILPRVFEIITQNAAKDPENLNSLRKDHTIAMTNGVGTLPESIKEEFVSSIFVVDVDGASTAPQYFDSYTPQYQEYFQGSLDTLVGQFTIRNRQFYYYPPGYFTSGTVNAANIASNILPITDHGWVTALAVQTYLGDGLTNELLDGTDYYVIVVNLDNIKLATTAANATAGTAMTVTPGGPGSFTIIPKHALSRFTGNITINSVTIPTLPSAIGDTVVIKDNLLEEAITLAANFVAGKTKMPGLDYPDLGNG